MPTSTPIATGEHRSIGANGKCSDPVGVLVDPMSLLSSFRVEKIDGSAGTSRRDRPVIEADIRRKNRVRFVATPKLGGVVAEYFY
jgi:hypothetical protein